MFVKRQNCLTVNAFTEMLPHFFIGFEGLYYGEELRN